MYSSVTKVREGEEERGGRGRGEEEREEGGRRRGVVVECAK